MKVKAQPKSGPALATERNANTNFWARNTPTRAPVSPRPRARGDEHDDQ